MLTFRIVPLRRGYRVEAVTGGGVSRLIKSWPTEEEAIAHLKSLRQDVELAERKTVIGGQDWRG